ncbi:MAG: hypothetical protein GY733_11785 [bacterium]|nr:hypothetical protein [bacterium]
MSDSTPAVAAPKLTAPTRRWRPRVVASLLLAGLVLTSSAPALASPDTLRRSVSNLVQAPLDLVFSPMVALVGVVTRMREQDDPIGVRLAFGAPGVVWNTGVNIGSSVIRFVTGGIELIPGVLLLPFEADLDPLFAPVDSGGALFEMETPCCIDVKFGIDYTAAEY